MELSSVHDLSNLLNYTLVLKFYQKMLWHLSEEKTGEKK